MLHLLTVFILLDSHLYAKSVLCFILHLRYLSATKEHPGYEVFTRYPTCFNEEDGEIAFSMLARSIVTDPDKFDFVKVNRNFQMIQTLMEMESDIAADFDATSSPVAGRKSPRAGKRKTSPKKVSKLQTEEKQDFRAQRYGVRVFDYKLADFENNEVELKCVREGIQETLQAIVDGSWMIYPANQSQYAAKPVEKLEVPTSKSLPEVASSETLATGFDELVTKCKRLLETKSDAPGSMFSCLKRCSSDTKSDTSAPSERTTMTRASKKRRAETVETTNSAQAEESDLDEEKIRESEEEPDDSILFL